LECLSDDSDIKADDNLYRYRESDGENLDTGNCLSLKKVLMFGNDIDNGNQLALKRQCLLDKSAF